jgi:hypothetical protein
MTAAEAIGPDCGPGHRAVRWMFSSRRSGRLTVVQWPNIVLWVFIILTVALHVFHPEGGTGTLIRVLADVALLLWATDELIRGVNPFRRILGLIVIVSTVYALTR